MIVVDGKLWMAVVRAPDKIDVRRIRQSLSATNVRLAQEAEFVPVFGDCEIGAIPIFGSAYGVPVIAAKELVENEEVVFNAGTHDEVLRVRVSDFLSVEKPRVLDREELLAA